jgi:acyl-homoserine lactone synthase
MIHLINQANAKFYRSELDSLFRLRHELYVRRRGWSAIDRGDGLEKDQFDTDAALYLLGLDDASGEILAGTRLMPTMGPHLMADVFPHIVTGDVPRGPDILEMTRYFTTPNRRNPRQMKRMGSEVLCAMFEYGLEEGINYITVVCDTFFLPGMQECGWKVEPLGLPHNYGEGSCIAVKFEVSERVLASTRTARGIDYRCLHRHQMAPILPSVPAEPLYA